LREPNFDKIDYWNLPEQSQLMNQQKTNICEIRFYLRIERFTIQIFLHNQLLIILEQGSQQYIISNQPIWKKYIKLSNQNTIQVWLKN